MIDAGFVVLANPAAGRGRVRRVLAAVLDRLREHGPVEVLTAANAADAEEAARKAVARGAAVLVAVGGDGTVHTALQAVAGTGTPLGIVPAGTGNDIAAELGVPADPVAAAAALAGATGTRTVDAARVTGPDGTCRWFAGVLGAGFDAAVNERANGMGYPRGARRYDLAILLELARLRARRYTIVLDGEPHERDAVLVAVGNTASYGGGMRICPAADPTDGLLDVVVADVDRRTLMRIKPRVYAGTHVDHPRVRVYRAATVVLAAEGVVTYADGERALPLPVTVACVPSALTLPV